MNLVITESVKSDVDGMQDNLRKIDKLEVTSIGGTPREALLEAFDGGMTFTAKDKQDNVVCMFGSVDSQVKDTGVIWMLGTPLVDKYKKDVMKLTHKFVKKVCEPYRHVYNYIHKDNKKSMRWLKWCGFNVDKSRTYQFGGEPFYFISKEVI